MKMFLSVFFGILAAVIFLVFLISGAAYYDLRSKGYIPDSQGNWHKDADAEFLRRLAK